MARATAVLVALLLSGCATTAPAQASPAQRRSVQVVAAENVWGSIARRLGGAHARVTSLVDNPAADPHDYEPTAADARRLVSADLTIVNGVGYDTWAQRLVAADRRRGRLDVTVGRLAAAPENGNPHLWYSPGAVGRVIDAVTLDLARLDPPDTGYFQAQRGWLLTRGLRPYFAALDDIRTRYAGTPIGASESVVVPLAAAAGLRLVTPAALLDAVSEGTDPSTQDTRVADAQIAGHSIAVYVYNAQNATPDVQAQVAAARRAGIPVVRVTETLDPAGTSFEDWQTAQLDRLQAALAEAAAR